MDKRSWTGELFAPPTPSGNSKVATTENLLELNRRAIERGYNAAADQEWLEVNLHPEGFHLQVLTIDHPYKQFPEQVVRAMFQLRTRERTAEQDANDPRYVFVDVSYEDFLLLNEWDRLAKVLVTAGGTPVV